MGRRSKENNKFVYVGSKNQILKDLESRKQQIKEAERERTERWIKNWINHQQSDFEKMLHKRSQYISEIASAIGLDSLSVAWSLSPFLTDDELEAAARESRSLYQERVVPMDFNSNLTDEQIKSLLPVMDKLVFAEVQTLESVRLWLRCEVTDPVPVKNNRYLALMLSVMSECGLICSNWAQVAEKRCVFMSKTNKIISASNLTTSLSRLLVTENQDVFKRRTLIESAVRGVKG